MTKIHSTSRVQLTIWKRTNEIHTALLWFGDTTHIFLESLCTFYILQGLENHFLQRMGHVIQVQADRLVQADKRGKPLESSALDLSKSYR